MMLNVSVFCKKGMRWLVIVSAMLVLLSVSNRGYALEEGPIIPVLPDEPNGPVVPIESNLALKTNASEYPEVSASYTCPCEDSVWKAVNGEINYDGGYHDRWTSWPTPNVTDWFAIDFGPTTSPTPPTQFNRVKLYIYDDGGGVKPPDSYVVQYWQDNDWHDVVDASESTESPQAGLNTIDFDTVTSSRLRVEFTNHPGSSSGLVEIEVFLHNLTPDEQLAFPVRRQIENLPMEITLADKQAVEAARIAYDNLTFESKVLIPNVSKLIAAEETIEALEALVVSYTDVDVLSTFGNADGDRITIQLSSVLKDTFSLNRDNFGIMIDGEQVTADDVWINLSDSSRKTVELFFYSPVLVDETSVTLSMLSGAIKTNENQLNNEVHSIPVFTFKKLDVIEDGLIDMDDIVKIIMDPDLQFDINQDGIFDREDVHFLLSQITPLTVGNEQAPIPK
jgi:hypothetical protein